MISVLILTKNEEQDLPGCLESVRWSDDVHVFDSMSTDRTVEIARAAGSTVTQRPFDNWSAHQNWGLANIPFKHEWVYYSDADERVTPELAEAMQKAVRTAGDNVAFRCLRRDYLNGTWLKHVAPSPFNIRLFRKDKMRYERFVNPLVLPQGPVGEMRQHFNHFPFSKGMTHWLQKHNSYSTLEAQQILANQSAGRSFSVWQALTNTDRNERRFHQKELFYRLPFRPLVKFLLLYVGKRGFLDGRAGLTYAMLQSFYEYMIVLKVRELKRAQAENRP